jgi:hypothetical protein
MYAADRSAGGPWRLAWDHGSAELQSLGGMLGPVQLRLGGGRELDPMHVAPWSGMTRADSLPGVLRRLRGEWPCVPFGRSDLPEGLPPGWTTHRPDDAWVHGYSANHRWHCVEATPLRVHLAIDYPDSSPIARVERVVAADPNAPALDISLKVMARTAVRMPVGLHPTFRLPPSPGRVKVLLGAHEGITSYPTNGAGSTSRLQPDTRSASLSGMAAIDGTLDLGLLPLSTPSEELIQVRAPASKAGAAPFALHYLDYDACVGLWWDTAQLPDLMLWVSNAGRADFPWMSGHFALGAEPVNSLFDLGRVATAPAGHPLADRLGLAMSPGQPWETHYRIGAWRQATPSPL